MSLQPNCAAARPRSRRQAHGALRSLSSTFDTSTRVAAQQHARSAGISISPPQSIDLSPAGWDKVRCCMVMVQLALGISMFNEKLTGSHWAAG